MKKLFFQFILLVFFTIPLTSQTECGFVSSVPCEPVFTDYSATDVTVNLVFHVIRRNDGTGGATSTDLGNYLSELATIYNPAGIYFNALCTSYIDSTYLFNHCDSAMHNVWDSFQTAMGAPNAVNIFIHPGGVGSGCAFGLGNIGGNSCYILNQGHRNLVSHEVGHVLNLLHTFEPCGGNHSCLGDSLSLIYDGDLCGDTPPDDDDFYEYIDTLTCLWDTAACISDGADCSDHCGTYPYPSFDFGIMMSYYHRCTQYFTSDQENRMKHKILNNLYGTYFNLNYADTIITDSVTVNASWRPAKNIIIENGGVLIVNSTIYMPEKAKIIIEPGGILSVKDGTITKGSFKDLCHERTGDPKFWYGIEMKSTQSGSFPKFYCSNGTVEYSEHGIHYATDSSGNAQIHVYSGVFKNNKISFELIGKTPNSLPVNIRKARFYLDGSFPLSNYYTQIKFDNAKIYIDSCLFDNPTRKLGLNSDAYSIVSMGATLGMQRSTFKDSIYGIQAMSFLSGNTLGITLTKFSKTFVGINTIDVDNYKVTKDTFDISWKCGLLSTNCKNYTINNNQFKKTSGFYANSIGIRMEESQEASNLISLNAFSDIKHGNFIVGNNGKKDNGLQLKCNTYTGIPSREVYFDTKSVFSGMQGADKNATGNTSNQRVRHALLLYDTAKYGFPTYYYKDSIYEHIPVSEPSYWMIKQPTNNVSCVIVGAPDTISRLVKYQKHVDTINDRKTKYVDSLDGGNTSVLLAYIAGANSGNAATLLYNHLINKSPWLGSSVLLAAYNRSDIFDSTRRAQLLYKNPDVFNVPSFKRQLYNADSPLPASSLQALDTLALYSTSRTNMDGEIATLKVELAAFCNDTLSDLKIDTIDHTDTIIAWHERAGDYGSMREILEHHYMNSDFTEASAALSDLEEIEELSDRQSSDRDALVELLPYMIDIREDNRYIGNLTEEEIEWMIEFAENNDNQAGSEVKSALRFYYDINVDDVESLRQVKNNRVIKGQQTVPVQDIVKSTEINIYPNPSKNELIIQFPQTEKGRWDIDINDINGTYIFGNSVSSNNVRIDISNIPNGIYIIQFKNHSGSRISKRIQILK